MKYRITLFLLILVLFAVVQISLCLQEQTDEYQYGHLTERNALYITDIGNIPVMFLCGVLLLIIFCSIAAAVGIGGGAIFLPILIIFMKFPPSQAAAISQGIMAGGTAASIILSLCLENNFSDNYKLVPMLAPMQLAGASIGATVCRVLPDWFLAFLSCTILVFSAQLSWKRCCDSPASIEFDSHASGTPSCFYVDETGRQMSCTTEPPIDQAMESFQVTNIAHDFTGDDGKSLLLPIRKVGGVRENHGPPTINKELRFSDEVVALNQVNLNEFNYRLDELTPSSKCRGCFSSTPCSTSTRRSILLPSIQEEENRFCFDLPLETLCPQKMDLQDAPVLCGKKFQLFAVFFLLLLWISHVMLVKAKGGKHVAGIIPMCSSIYWLLTVISPTLLLICGFTAAIGIAVTEIQSAKSLPSYVDCIKQICLEDCQSILVLSLQTFLAGFLAGLAGIGGGMIIGPLLLNRGLDLLVVSTTNCAVVFFTASATSLNFYVDGQLPLETVAILGTLSFFTSLVTRWKTYLLWKRSGNVLIKLLTCVLCFAGLVMFWYGINNLRRHGLGGFKAYCA